MQHESNVGSSSWSWLLVLAGAGALLGLIIRRSAESLVDELDDGLDDESWKRRVAPLVSEQERRSGKSGRLAFDSRTPSSRDRRVRAKVEQRAQEARSPRTHRDTGGVDTVI